MISKQLIIGGIAAVALTATAAYKVFDPNDYAEVLNVAAISKNVSVPKEECRDELVSVQHPTQDPNQITGTVAGAVIGGVVGNQIGDGSGKKVATAGGAIVGAITGKKVQEGMQERNVDQVSKRVCETTQVSHSEPAGYNVTYLLGGQERMVWMPKDPGRRVAIKNGTAVVKQ